MSKKQIVNCDNVDQVIEELLEIAFWPKGLMLGDQVQVLTDDSDGKPDANRLVCVFGPDGDISVNVREKPILKPGLIETRTRPFERGIRIRTRAGGGNTRPVYNALLVLAKAMKKCQEK